MIQKHLIHIVICLILLVSSTALGQSPYRETVKETTRDHLVQPILQTEKSVGLLDASRVSMNHQVGMGYMSSGGHGYTQGYYLNTIGYRFTAPVTLKLRMGVANNPYAQTSGTGYGQSALGGMLNNAEFFGGADLDWRPADNVLFRISVDKLAPGMYRSGHYGNLFMGGWNGFPYDGYSPFYPGP